LLDQDISRAFPTNSFVVKGQYTEPVNSNNTIFCIHDRFRSVSTPQMLTDVLISNHGHFQILRSMADLLVMVRVYVDLRNDHRFENLKTGHRSEVQMSMT